MKSLIEIMKIPFFVKFDRKGISFYVFYFLAQITTKAFISSKQINK